MTTVVVTFVLMMVLVSGRFIKYLAQAAAGEIAADALLLIMLFRMPEFLQMILPLSMFVGTLLVFGRLGIDNEIVAMRAGGISLRDHVRGLLFPIFVAMVVVGSFSLYVTPRGDAEVARVFEEQSKRSVLELLTPGRFFSRGYDFGQRSTYAEHVGRREGMLENVFIAEIRDAPAAAERSSMIVRAETGRLVQREGISYLELENGIQYQGVPGLADFDEVAFDRALVQIGEERGPSRPPKVRGRSTLELLESPGHEAYAELEWRLSLILLVPIAVIAAVPLGQVNPRQGRFGKLIPAVLGYMLYMGLLLVMRSKVADLGNEPRPWYLDLVWVHLLAALAVALLFLVPTLRYRRLARQGGRI